VGEPRGTQQSYRRSHESVAVHGKRRRRRTGDGREHRREIHLLSTIVRPTIAAITSIGYAHMGISARFVPSSARARDTRRMHDPSGFLMLNGDDRLLVEAARRIKKDIVFFGFSSRCAVRARNICIVDGRATRFRSTR